MIEHLRIYNFNETDFSKNGLAILDKASDVCITREINDTYQLTFKLPPIKEKWQYVQNENIVKCEGQLFRIKTIVGDTITATHIYQDCALEFFPTFAAVDSMTPYNFMVNLLVNTNLHVMTSSEVSALGMEWITEMFSIKAQEKISPFGGIVTMISTLSKQSAFGELYVDNYNIAFVKRIGTDRGYRIDTKLNAKDIKITRDTSTMVTRLYPFGKDDMTIGSVHSTVYLDSEYIGNYPIHKGYASYSELDDASDLLAYGQWLFSQDNYNRVDVPKYTVDVDIVDLSKSREYKGFHQWSLGDTATVIDRKYDITVKQRIVSMQYYPFEPTKTKLTVGLPKKDASKLFDSLVTSAAIASKTKTDLGETRTGWLECMQGNESVTINSNLHNEEIAQYSTGALFVSSDGSAAIAIIKGVIAIADSKTGGQWDWTTIMDSGKVIVNDVYTGTLNTSLCKIIGDDGNMTIEDNLITFTDTSNAVRLKMGLESGSYIFSMYDSEGNAALTADAAGNLTLRGGIQGYDASGNKSGLWCNEPSTMSSERFGDITSYWMGTEIFRMYNNADGSIDIKSYGTSFLRSSGSITTMLHTWKYGGYNVANTKNVDDLQSYCDNIFEQFDQRLSNAGL